MSGARRPHGRFARASYLSACRTRGLFRQKPLYVSLADTRDLLRVEPATLPEKKIPLAGAGCSASKPGLETPRGTSSRRTAPPPR